MWNDISHKYLSKKKTKQKTGTAELIADKIEFQVKKISGNEKWHNIHVEPNLLPESIVFHCQQQSRSIIPKTHSTLGQYQHLVYICRFDKQKERESFCSSISKSRFAPAQRGSHNRADFLWSLGSRRGKGWRAGKQAPPPPVRVPAATQPKTAAPPTRGGPAPAPALSRHQSAPPSPSDPQPKAPCSTSALY